MYNTASNGYALKIMTVVAVVLLPFVVAYQAWSYYVFRRRISAREFAPGSSVAGEAADSRLATSITRFRDRQGWPRRGRQIRRCSRRANAPTTMSSPTFSSSCQVEPSARDQDS